MPPASCRKQQIEGLLRSEEKPKAKDQARWWEGTETAPVTSLSTDRGELLRLMIQQVRGAPCATERYFSRLKKLYGVPE